MKILYGVAGEGNGHAVRSKVIIDYLKKRHEIKIAAGGAAYNFLKKYYDVEEIHYFFIKYSNNKVKNLHTFFANIIRIPAYLKSLFKMLRIADEFKPDLIITDWEAITTHAGIIKRKPIISIDNAQIIPMTKIEIPKKNLLSHIKAKIFFKLLTPKADYYFITSFFGSQKIKNNATIIPPIVRDEIANRKTSRKDHYFVYQTSKSNKKLLEILKEIPEKFIVYGFDTDKKETNVCMKKNNEKQFFDELASCKGVIANGGFTLLTEAIYLGKPTLSLPIKGQIEQEINAHYLEKLGLGMSSRKTHKKKVEEFIKYAEKYAANKSMMIADEKHFKLIEKKMREFSE